MRLRTKTTEDTRAMTAIKLTISALTVALAVMQIRNQRGGE